MNVTYGSTVAKVIKNFKLIDDKLAELTLKLPEYFLTTSDETIFFYKKIKYWWGYSNDRYHNQSTSIMYDVLNNKLSTSYSELEQAKKIAEIINCDIFVYCIGK